MRNLLIMTLLIFTLSCSNKETIEKEIIITKNNLDWLVGKWIRTNGEIGKQTFENWEKIDFNNYVGLGCTLINSDTTFEENLRLTRANGIWTFEVRGVNAEMTPFIFIEQTDTSFVCENKTNDFPKKIEYLIGNNTLTAIISDENKEIPFIFNKYLNQ